MDNQINEIINNWIKFENTDIILDLSFNNLDELPVLPENVKHLYCNSNNLKSLKNLPGNLISLKCEGNMLKEIVNLPISLTHLDCYNNDITNIILPINLIMLKCNDNDISNLNLLNNLSLRFIDCSDNNISDLNLPTNLINLKCINNKIKELILNKNLKYLIADKFTKINNYEILINNNSVDINTFNNFYEVNINKCFLVNSYPINKENVNTWIQKIKTFNDKKLNTFAYSITSTLNHISFKMFYDSLCNLAYKLLQFMDICVSENSDIIFYFYIKEIYKSNLWVLLLVWKFINKTTNNIKIISDLHILKNNNINNNFYIIYLDDCSYTGMQILDNIFNIREKVVVFVPYISNNSLETLNGYQIDVRYITTFYNFSKILYSKNSKYEYECYMHVIDIYDQYVNGEEMNNKNICNIYFDHKLADFISIFQPLYAYGRLPDNSDVGSFISGCESFYKNNVIHYKTVDLQNELPSICPSAFYKTIKYENVDEIQNKIF